MIPAVGGFAAFWCAWFIALDQGVTFPSTMAYGLLAQIVVVALLWHADAGGY